jgi:hypothetical protein
VVRSGVGGLALAARSGAGRAATVRPTARRREVSFIGGVGTGLRKFIGKR